MHSHSIANDSLPITELLYNACFGNDDTKYYYLVKGWSIKHYYLLNQVISNG